MITMAEAAQATGGEWLSQPHPMEMPVYRGAFDTRNLHGAEIFFALPGEGADGHQFLAKLKGGPVKLALVSREEIPPGISANLLRVPDVLAALGQLGACFLRKYRPKVVAITGSYGKTTAKEVIAHVLARGRRVLKTPGSHNNEIGLPLALLELDGSQDTAVLEYSARKEGDIEYLGAIAPPDIAVLLAVGRAHVGVFGSQEAIYRAKGEIFNHLNPEGLALVGAEDPRLAQSAAGHRTLTFGRDTGDFHARDISTDAKGRQQFTGLHGQAALALRSGIPGPHGLYPLLAAWAVARELGLSDEQVAARPAFDPGQKGRAVLLQAPGGADVLDDSYNASPETVLNLIATLGSMAGNERILVLGSLSELEEGLGPTVEIIGRALAPPLDQCLVYAPATPGFAEDLAGLAAGCPVREFGTLDELIAALRKLDAPGRVIGIKGARAAHMERAVRGLLGAGITCRLETCGLLMSCTDCDEMTRTV